MSLREMILSIQKLLHCECLSDVVERTGVSSGTIIRWKEEPPERPSLFVFYKLARYFGFRPSVSLMDNLI